MVAWQRRWLYEDGIINLRIIENAVAGHGPVFNEGQRVEAYTSPAQIAIMTAARGLTFGAVRVEDVVFVVGVLAAAAGLLLGMLGAIHLWGGDDEQSWTVPIGGLAFAAVPAAWDFATSGHEGGLSYLWLGGSLWILSRRARELRCGFRPPVDRGTGLLLWLGSGALVRPEYGLYTVALGIAWFVLHRDTGGSRIRAAATALSLTLAYQVFRMGYFGLLLPNTAVAKLDAGLPASWYYVGTFIRPYALWLPLVVVGGLTLALALRSGSRERLVVAAFVTPSVIQVLYLVSIGGDYINARLLLPPYLAFLLPVAALPTRLLRIQARRTRPAPRPLWIGAVGVLALWAIVCASTLRPPWHYTDDTYLDPRWDARAFTMRLSLHGTPSRRVSEYRESFLSGPYRDLFRAEALGYTNVMSARDPFLSQQVTLPPGSRPAIITRAIGATGALTYPAHVYDVLGLADPIAAHVPAHGKTPGHVRALPNAWFYAAAGVASDPDARAAELARSCGDLADLVAAADDDLTPGRFLRNILSSPRNTFLDVPADPHEAVDAFC